MSPLNGENSHILISRTDGIFDVILTMPMVRALRQRYRNVKISLLILRDSYDLAKLCSDVDQVFIYEPKTRHRGIRGFFRLANDLQNENFDSVIAVFPRWSLALLFWYLLIPNRIGTSRRPYSFMYNYRVKFSRRNSLNHETTFNLRLLLPYGIDLSAKDDIYPVYQPRSEAVAKIGQLLSNAKVSDPFVIMQPILTESLPGWPTSYMVDLAYLIIKRLGMAIFIFGAKDEVPQIDDLIEKIQTNLEPNQWPLVQSAVLDRADEQASLFREAALFIGNHSGSHYLAVGCGTPAIVFFPLTPGRSPRRYAPYGPGRFIALRPDLPECVACIQSKCEYKNCLSYIFPEVVFEEVQHFLKKKNTISR